ncbi:MAG: PP2C family protein-serine/threonine phosphatase [Turneriella sp.]
MKEQTLIIRLAQVLFGDSGKDSEGHHRRLVFFPRRLPEQLDELFFNEYVRALRIPVIWVTVLVFFIVQIGICYYQSSWPYINHMLAVALVVGALTISHIFFIWDLTKKWGYKNQLTILNILLGLLVAVIGWGTFMCWQTMPDHYIGMMTTIFGSILGAAAVILSYSRISYQVFMTGLIIPGVTFMFTHQGPFYTFMGLLFSAGFFSFSIINLMEYAKQRQLFDARHQLAVINSELSRKDAELDQELVFASHIQMGIFPEPKTVVHPYAFQTTVLPLGRISGDYCDIVARGDITFAVVADASGHGVPAAMLTMAAKNVFNNLLSEKISPALALARANHEILKMIKTQDFMTGFLLKLYPSGLVEFSNAAHPTAFCQTRQGDLRFLDTSGFILGGLDDVDALYENGSVQLQAGDRLFLYTDGVIECMNPENHFYGVDRLEKILRITRGLELSKVIPRVFSDMISYCEGVPFRDDIAMMAIEFNP